jgi:hypothetical protein
LFFLITSLGGCNNECTLQLPKSDVTPPTYEWLFEWENNNGITGSKKFVDDGTYKTESCNVGDAKKVRVYFSVGDEDGGISSLAFTGKDCDQKNLSEP